jgi:hypothetical protein
LDGKTIKPFGGKRKAVIPADVRFWSYVNKDGPVPQHMPHLGRCWVWISTRCTDGRGKFGVSSTQRAVLASRFAWELEYGPIVDGLQVLHKCDGGFIGCVRVSHLFLGTQQDNVDDMVRKRRGRTKLSLEQVVYVRKELV